MSLRVIPKHEESYREALLNWFSIHFVRASQNTRTDSQSVLNK
jgi:hypothetical protein